MSKVKKVKDRVELAPKPRENDDILHNHGMAMPEMFAK